MFSVFSENFLQKKKKVGSSVDSKPWLSLCLVLAAGGGQGMPCGGARGGPGGPGPRPALTLVSLVLME